MAMIARPAAQRLGPAIPTGFGAVMKWLADHDDDGDCPWCGARHGMAQGVSRRASRTVSQRRLVQSRGSGSSARRPKRKVSAYQREFGRQLKKLKKAHPRTPVTRLMKRAHTATKKARRGK